MAVTFRILPQYGIISVRYVGIAGVQETSRALAALHIHPDFRVHYRHVVDLSQMTGYERDYPAIMALQAKAAEHFLPPDSGPFIVHHAPTPVSQAMARVVMRTWEAVPNSVVVMFAEAQEVMEFLGLPGLPLQSLAPVGDRAS